MGYIIGGVIFIFSVLLYSFMFANMLLPLFYSLPTFYKFRKRGYLVKPIPFFKIALTPLIWTSVFILTSYYIPIYLQDYLVVIIIAAVFAFFGIIGKLLKNDPELLADFLRTYSLYLKT